MKKYYKLLVFLLSLVIIFVTYNKFFKESKKITYIALGDSIAEGMNSYSQIDYGYSDYIKDYLEENNRLSFYTKGFSKSGYTTENLKNDIEDNKDIQVNGKNIKIIRFDYINNRGKQLFKRTKFFEH